LNEWEGDDRSRELSLASPPTKTDSLSNR
jgi:hypothetical protein